MLEEEQSCLEPDTRKAREDAYIDDPGPSGLQKSYNSLMSEDTSLEVMLEEMESTTLELNTPITGNINSNQSVDMSELNSLLAINEAFREILANLIRRVLLAISRNRDAQKLLKAKMRQQIERGLRVGVKKVPVSRFLFPYFRDSHDMEPPRNREYELKIFRREYDPLVKEEKKWTAKECQALVNAVRKSLIEIRIQPFIQKKEMFAEKIRASGQETSAEQISDWKSKITELERLITYHKNLPDSEVFVGDYAEVDWAKIAKIDFLCNRTPRQVRLKWINEQCPRWSKEPWSEDELQRLKECAERWNNWNVIAERLGTNRTAFQCFVKFRSEIDIENVGRSWTKEEDANLMTLAHCMQVNGKMHWDKIAHHMEGRSRQQCTIRYRRALDTDIKFGRWDASEDVLLTCAVSRFGTKDWMKVASCVAGRSDSQCRDRWVNVLDKNIKAEPWSVDEDEKLLEGVRIFGKGEWSRISLMIPGRSASHCKSRFRSLVSAKVKLASECRKYPFRRFSWKGKYRRQKVEAAFKKLLASDDENGIAEQVMNSFNMEALSVDEMEALSSMTLEQRLTVMQFLNEVREKHLETGNENKQSFRKLLEEKMQLDASGSHFANIRLEDVKTAIGEPEIANTIKSYLDNSTRVALFKYYKRFFGESTCDLLNPSEKNEFELKYTMLLEVDRKAAKDFVINGLCDLVDRNDTIQCCNYQKRFTKYQVLEEIRRYFNTVLIFDLNRAVPSNSHLFTLPPFVGSLRLYEKLQANIRLLRSLAEQHFEPITPGENDSLFLQLSQQVKTDAEYNLCKATMRALLFWPMLLYCAIEKNELVAKRVWLRSLATEKLTEQQNLAVESLKIRIQSHFDPELPEQEELPYDGASEISVGEYLKQRMLKLTRSKENIEAMKRRIDECIESVCIAVQRIYERDFMNSAADETAVQHGRNEITTNSVMDSEMSEVKSTLDLIIDKVVNDKILKTLLRKPELTGDRISKKDHQSMLGNKHRQGTKVGCRKRSSPQTVKDSEQMAGMPKRAKKNELVGMVEEKGIRIVKGVKNKKKQTYKKVESRT